MPKSSSLARSPVGKAESATIITLSGLRSRWMMSLACAAASAERSVAKLDRRLHRQPSALRLEASVERLALEQLHHDVGGAIGSRSDISTCTSPG